ncbi:MAG: ATPase [Cloacibacterium sp.]|nr:ATPase [Cloacibacterium sp.]
MIAIVDGGSTKCDWVILENNGKEFTKTQTLGFNPNIIDAHLIVEELEKNAILSANKDNMEHIYFYGAGCGVAENRSTVESQMQKVFSHAKINVKEDLSAAAYAAYQGKPAIVCILGTGSNSCYFDGENIRRELPSLGFLIGDEGSGCALGKHILRNFFMKKLPKDLENDFQETYQLSINELLQKMYHNPHASAYLASFNTFIAERKSHPYIQHLIYREMKNFFEYHVLPYPESLSSEINFIGSIAFLYQDILKSAAADYRLNIGTFVQKPIESLVNYHKKYILNLG